MTNGVCVKWKGALMEKQLQEDGHSPCALGDDGGSGGAMWCDRVVWFVVVASPLGFGPGYLGWMDETSVSIKGANKHYLLSGDGVRLRLVTVVEASMCSPGEVEPKLVGMGPGWTAVSTRGITSIVSSSLSVVHCTVCSVGGDG
ncbi:hypothetical protein E2C01_028214 [Portunus trituberculatus]|uniref:Uncharacterized protein n=1 Tax=Portunus trituberculatus TaxID=210409 RepID=A0A5B7EKR7_PORTR|nr:hypothetical protein [Portunus trituberculatus]